ncbi:MAG: flagellar hook capping FlgD N-terminal domain-containing protein [Chloroflexota bacterium]
MPDNVTYPIGPGSTQPWTPAKPTYVNPNEGIDKDAFLKLLVAQLRYQDPMNPMQDRDFILQMAQLTGMEQAQNSARTQRIGQAAGLIGRQIEYINFERLKILTAEVKKVVITDGGEPQLVVAGPDPKDPTKTITATIDLDAMRTILPAAGETDDTDETGETEDTEDTEASGSGQ